ncbi:MAG: UxaA family hydrolase [Chloroflexota bacterium]
MKRKAILMHSQDDVATALTELAAGEEIEVELSGRRVSTVVREEIQFAHKYALRNIAKGEPILKYGMPIGKALEDIQAGQWVHVHNCRSDRWGFQNDKYGIQA